MQSLVFNEEHRKIQSTLGSHSSVVRKIPSSFMPEYSHKVTGGGQGASKNMVRRNQFQPGKTVYIGITYLHPMKYIILHQFRQLWTKKPFPEKIYTKLPKVYVKHV